MSTVAMERHLIGLGVKFAKRHDVWVAEYEGLDVCRHVQRGNCIWVAAEALGESTCPAHSA